MLASKIADSRCRAVPTQAVGALPQNFCMKTLGSGNGPDADSEETWTNETLPLGMRRELLERELQRFIAKKQAVQSGVTKKEGAGERRSGKDHPKADGSSPGEERAS